MDTPKHVAVLDRITAERRRQEDLKASGRFKLTCADDGLSDAEKLAILTEEVGEVARAVQIEGGMRLAPEETGGLRTELIQIAAIAGAWAESLE